MRVSTCGVLLVVALLVGCVHTYDIQAVGGERRKIRLSPDAPIFVGLPEDGSYGGTIYTGSGRMTNQALVTAFAKHTRLIRSADSVMDLEGNIAAAKEASSRVLIHPEIMHWEERSTEWSGLPDRISIRVLLVDVSEGKTLDSTVISGKSRWATFGGDHPQDLLPVPLEEYAGRFF